MSRAARSTVVFALIAVLISLFALSAFATDEGGVGEGEGGEIAPTTTIDSGLSPAVSVDTSELAPEQLDWTYRYIIPVALVLAAIVVVATSIKYFTDVVRKRYRIVEE